MQTEKGNKNSNKNSKKNSKFKTQRAKSVRALKGQRTLGLTTL